MTVCEDSTNLFLHSRPNAYNTPNNSGGLQPSRYTYKTILMTRKWNLPPPHYETGVTLRNSPYNKVHLNRLISLIAELNVTLDDIVIKSSVAVNALNVHSCGAAHQTEIANMGD